MNSKEVISLLDRIEQSLISLQIEEPHNNSAGSMLKTKTAPSTVKESLIKELTELSDIGTVMTDDPRDAEDLAKKGVNVKLTKEVEEGIKFSPQETAEIAQETGKALAKALRAAGDEVDGMRAFRIEQGAFDIKVRYKSGTADEFSFYIDNDRLILVDFNGKYDLGEVGTKPSGEPLVHREVLENEFLKVFKSLNEEEFEKVKVDTNAPATTGAGDRLYIGDIISIGSQEKGTKYFEIQYNPQGGVVMLQPVGDPNSLDPIGPPVIGGNPLFHKILIKSTLVSSSQPADVREERGLSKIREEYKNVIETIKQSAKRFAQGKREERQKIFTEFKAYIENKKRLQSELIEELKESLIHQLAKADEKNKLIIRRKLKSSMWTDADIDKALEKYNEKYKPNSPVQKTQETPKWNAVKYKTWIRDMASNGGAANAFDMAQNAKLEKGLIDYVKKNIHSYGGDEDPLERIQWDIEAYY